jgi:apolipoprotein N-acyltransferase
VQPRVGLTPYAKVGNWPVVIVSLLLLAAGFGPLVAASRRDPK